MTESLQENINKTMILRQAVPYSEENFGAGIRMQARALDILEKVYMTDGRTLFLHVPAEDMDFQEKVGGTSSSPALIGLFTAEGTPIRAFPRNELPCFSYLDPVVIPLFTAERRVYHFVQALQENLYVIPECRLALLSYDTELGQQISEGSIVINPLPELFMCATFPLIDGAGNLVMAAPVPGISEIGKPKETAHKTRVVGVTFEGRQWVIASLSSGQELRLRREPSNAYDQNAIRVECLDGRQIGYINQNLARELAPTLDKVGGTIPAKVAEVTGGGSGYNYGVEISYHLA